MKWINVNDDLPKKSGMYITKMLIISEDGLAYRPAGYNNFDLTLNKFTNPRLCTESALVTEWLDETESASFPTTEEEVRSKEDILNDLIFVDDGLVSVEIALQAMEEYASQFRSSGITTPSK